MVALFYIGFIGFCILVMVGIAGALQIAEARSPAFKDFLDRNFPDDGRWS